MSRFHGSDARAYLGGRDISADAQNIGFEASVDTHERTTFASDGWHESDPGLGSWTAPIDAFYDGSLGGIGRQLEQLLGASGGILSIYLGDADAIGDEGRLGSDSILEKYGEPVNVADLVKLQGALKGSGRAGLEAILLHPNGQETVTGNAASHDGGASSANGGRANLHILAITGTWTVKIQHSSDNSTWADLVTFTSATTTGAETKTVTGTVNRYLRAVHTEDVAGSLTYVVGFARF